MKESLTIKLVQVKLQKLKILFTSIHLQHLKITAPSRLNLFCSLCITTESLLLMKLFL